MNKIRNFFAKQLTLSAFATITAIGLFAGYFRENIIYNFYQILDISSAVALATLAVVAYYKYTKENDKIEIYTKKPNEEKQQLSTYIVRKNFTRAEIFGILGALHKEGKFEIKYTSSIDFAKDVFDVQTGKKEELIIKLDSKDEFEIK